MRAGDRRKINSITGALSASLALDEVFKEAMPLLMDFCGADYGALWAPDAERPHQSVWSPYNLPSAFFDPCSYAQMRQHDRVYAAVSQKTGRVLCDDEMIDRSSFKQDRLYRRAREAGTPIKQVMAVMLHVGDDFQSGLSLYRERPRPFSDRDQNRLQELTPWIANTVRNCWRYAEAARKIKQRDCLVDDEETGAILFTQSSLRRIDQTSLATRLLDAWFPGNHRDTGGIPSRLLEELAKAQAAWERGEAGPWYWRCERETAELKVTFRRLPDRIGEPAWKVTLREIPPIQTLPVLWRARLAPEEQKVCELILLGWDNELIAKVRNRSVYTVKKQVTSIFLKLDVLDRKDLQALALRYR